MEAVREKLRRNKDKGMRGLKLSLAYNRDLHFAPRTLAEAEAVFNRVMEEGYGWRPHSLGWNEQRPLTDFLVHRLAEIAGELELPIVFHSAMQAHDEHNADDARPLRLWNLPHRHRRTTFIILHGGFPWMSDAAQLAKHYPNVYLDLAWAHLMSPEISARGLLEWIDLVPMHKIFGFGGDYCVVEKVYGHLVLARHALARAPRHRGDPRRHAPRPRPRLAAGDALRQPEHRLPAGAIAVIGGDSLEKRSNGIKR